MAYGKSPFDDTSGADLLDFLEDKGITSGGGGGGSGTVTSASVVSANGLAGTVATATTTPAITLRTTVTGLLKGNGTAISAAVADTDYTAPATLTSGLALKAPLASPALTGVPTAPTAAPATNTTQVATTAFVLANAGGGGGSGTVTSASVVSANGLGGTVATATTTPAITLTTSVTGVLKGNGTAISAAAAGTDYLAPTGSGAGLTGLTVSQLPTGILATNVPKLDANGLLQAAITSGLPGRSPDRIATCVAWLDASSIVDVLDGAKTATFPDRVGGYNATQATSGNQPTYLRRGMNGRPALRFKTASVSKMANASLAWNTVGTFAFVIQPGNLDGNKVYFAGSAGLFFNEAYGALAITNNPVTAPHTPGPVLAVWTNDGTTVTLRINGVYSATAGGIATAALTGFTVGDYSGAGFPWEGMISDIALFSTVLTGTSLTDMEAWLMARAGIGAIPDISKPLIVFDGNSVMSGYQTFGAGNLLSEQIMNLLGRPDVTYRNFAFAGAYASALNTRRPALIDVLYSTARRVNLLVILEGWNDLTYNDLKTYIDGAVTVGWDVVVFSLPGSGSTYGTDAARLTYNTSLHTDYDGHAKVVIADVGSDPRMQAQSVALWTLNHPNALGTGVFAHHGAVALAQLGGFTVGKALTRTFPCVTTNATIRTVKQVPVPLDSTSIITLRAVARRTDSGTESAAFDNYKYRVETTSVGVVTVTAIGSGTADYATLSTAVPSLVAATTSATNPGVLIKITGEASKTLAWNVQYERVSATIL